MTEWPITISEAKDRLEFVRPYLVDKLDNRDQEAFSLAILSLSVLSDITKELKRWIDNTAWALETNEEAVLEQHDTCEWYLDFIVKSMPKGAIEE